MKMYLWERLDQVSENYHCEGGLVVIAKDKKEVKKLIKAKNEAEEWGPDIEIKDEEWKDVKIFEMNENNNPEIFYFPDAGCC